MLALAISIIAPAVADRRNETERFTVLDRAADDEQNISFIDVGGHDFTVGDYFVIELDPLFNRSDTRRVADSSGDCLVVAIDQRGSGATIECDTTFHFSRGSLAVEATVEFTETEESGVGAVTGGTGTYKAADGQVRISSVDRGLLFQFEVLK